MTTTREQDAQLYKTKYAANQKNKKEWKDKETEQNEKWEHYVEWLGRVK